MGFGDAVRANRKAKGLRQDELGLIVGVSQAKISRIENGGSLAWELARHLAVVLDLDLNAFKSTLPAHSEVTAMTLDAVLAFAVTSNIDLNAFKPTIPIGGDPEASAA